MSCIFPNGSNLTIDDGFSATTQEVQSVGGFARSAAVADVTPLKQKAASGNAATYKKKKVANRIEHEAIEIPYFFDPASDDALPEVGDHGAPRELTLVYPDGSKQLNGKGYIVANDIGGLVSDEVVIGTLSFMFIGGTTDGEFPVIENVAA